MEVGVCAEAYQGGEPTRHINSAFMTFEVLDSDRKPRTLPRIRPEPVVSFLFKALYPKIHRTKLIIGIFFCPPMSINLCVCVFF